VTDEILPLMFHGGRARLGIAGELPLLIPIDGNRSNRAHKTFFILIRAKYTYVVLKM